MFQQIRNAMQIPIECVPGVREFMENQQSQREYALLIAWGSDRPGLLDEISAFLLERSGKIEEIKVVELGGHFTFLARVAGIDSAIEKVKRDLLSLESQSHITATIQPYRADADRRGDGFPYRFTAKGKGQATSMRKISHLMRVLNINIEDVKTRITGEAPQSGPASFELELLLSVPRTIPVTMLRDYLQHLCSETNTEWTLSAL
jgi:glycine cleavage system transcriptional repressor